MIPDTLFSIPISIRWADLDANFHMRHSVYYDLGAQVRVAFLEKQGITLKNMQEHHFGPILFREECVFKREIKPHDEVTINLRLIKLKRDYSKFSFMHEFIKKDGTLSAVLTIDGAWMDTNIRKIASPPAFVHEIIMNMPKSENFVWLD